MQTKISYNYDDLRYVFEIIIYNTFLTCILLTFNKNESIIVWFWFCNILWLVTFSPIPSIDRESKVTVNKSNLRFQRNICHLIPKNGFKPNCCLHVLCYRCVVPVLTQNLTSWFFSNFHKTCTVGQIRCTMSCFEN